MTTTTAELAGQQINLKKVLPYLLSIAVLTAAVIAGFMVGTGGNSVVGGVLDASSNSSNRLGTLGDFLPFGFAFAAGMVSTVNPCGFMMLPAYLGLYVGTGQTGEKPPLHSRLFKGASVSVAMARV